MMSDENSIEVPEENNHEDEQEQTEKDSETKRLVPTVADLDDVQLFCAEFHIKVENATGIRPWLQFSDSNFTGNYIMPRQTSCPI